MALVPRLRAFGEALLRGPDALDAGEMRTLSEFFDAPGDDERLWVATAATDEVVGAAYAECLQDYFTQERHAHLGILMVAEQAEGRGVGRALIQTVEQWARDSGFRFITLNVFAANEAAQRFYRKAAYRADYVRYIKPLDD